MQRAAQKRANTAGPTAEEADRLLSLAEHQWFGGLFSGEGELAVVRLLLRAYQANTQGQPIHKKAAAAALGVEDVRTARKYVDLVERHGLLSAVADAKDKRKELLVPTARLTELIAREIEVIGSIVPGPAIDYDGNNDRNEEAISDQSNGTTLIDFARYIKIDFKLLLGWPRKGQRLSNAELESTQAWKKGREYFEQEDYSSTISELSKLLKAVTQNIDMTDYDLVYAARGTAHLMSESFQIAIYDLSRALDLNKNRLFLYSLRAIARFEENEFDGADHDFTRVIDARIGPLRARALYFRCRGIARMKLGKKSDAIEDLQEALALDPRLKDVSELLTKLGA